MDILLQHEHISHYGIFKPLVITLQVNIKKYLFQNFKVSVRKRLISGVALVISPGTLLILIKQPLGYQKQQRKTKPVSTLQLLDYWRVRLSHGRSGVRLPTGLYQTKTIIKMVQSASLHVTQCIRVGVWQCSPTFQKCLWGHALKRSPVINRKSRVLYPDPGFLSSATWPSLPKSTIMENHWKDEKQFKSVYFWFWLC